MAKRVKFVLNRRAFREQVLMGDGVASALEARADSAKPTGDDILVETDYASDRVRVRIVDDSFKAMWREAREGHLSSAIGLSAGDRKVWYTTRAGKRRLASQAQINNWTRGRR